MKTAVLLHGTGGNDHDYFWFNDTKQWLQAHGYAVWWPQLPNADKPELQACLDYVIANMPTLEPGSAIIGHSSACPLILSLLEQLTEPVSNTVLVSGFYQPIASNPDSRLMLQPAYDWTKIRAMSEEIYFINSDNDPWGCTDAAARPAAEALYATLITMIGHGHMGSDAHHQSYRQLPIVKQLLATV